MKVSCPHCSQHIACDESYSGRAIACPVCGKNFLIPAQQDSKVAKRAANQAPQRPGATSVSKPSARRQPPRRRSAIPKPLLVALSAAALLVVLVIVIGKVLGSSGSAPSPASGNQPAAPTNASTPSLAANPELQKAQQAVLTQIQALRTAAANGVLAQQRHDALHNFYHGKTLPNSQYQAVMQQYKAVDDAIVASQTELSRARAGFEAAYARYQQLGGKTDYRKALP